MIRDTNTTAACNPLSSRGGLNYFPISLNKTLKWQSCWRSNNNDHSDYMEQLLSYILQHHFCTHLFAVHGILVAPSKSVFLTWFRENLLHMILLGPISISKVHAYPHLNWCSALQPNISHVITITLILLTFSSSQKY